MTSEQPAGSTSVIEREEVTQRQDPGDNERFSHYVRQDRLMRSTFAGGPVVAICGKVWTPSRDPKKYPVCPTCKEIYERLSGGQDGSNNGQGNNTGSNSGSGWPF